MVSTEPLISIAMPCYNSRGSLALAFSSLICQTYKNWECIFVDDGSTDRPVEVVEQLSDTRIKYFCHEHNQGRGTARQTALDNARGDYLCMLDADDWIFPQKLERQLDVMLSNDQLALVSTGVAVVNHRNMIVGIKKKITKADQPLIVKTHLRAFAPTVVHASCMIKMNLAKGAGYDTAYRDVEDADFLLKVLLGRRYGLLSEVQYVYNEFQSKSEARYFRGYVEAHRMFSKYRESYPVSSRISILKLYLKSLIYKVYFSLFSDASGAIRGTLVPPTKEEEHCFIKAQQKVTGQMHRLFVS